METQPLSVRLDYSKIPQEPKLEKQDSAISLSAGDGSHGDGSGGKLSDGALSDADGQTTDEQELDPDEHIPAHRAIHCSLCRRKHNYMQHSRHYGNAEIDNRSQSLSDLSSTSSTNRSSWLASANGPMDRVEKGSEISTISTDSRHGVAGSGRGDKDRDSVSGQPITDPVLLGKIRSARSSAGAKITDKDQKILQLMLKKRELERDEAERQSRAALQRDVSRQTARQSRHDADLARRQQLAEQRHQQHTKRLDSVSHRRMLEARELREREQNIRHCDRRWAQQSQKQLELQRLKLEEKKRSARERKHSQERRLEIQEKEREDFHRSLTEKSQRDLRRANSLRDAREEEKNLERKRRNEYQMKKHENRIQRIKRQSSEDLKSLKKTLEIKDQMVKSNQQQAHEQREKDRHAKELELDERLQKSRQKQELLSKELEFWREDLLSYTKMMENKAKDISQRTAEQKRQKSLQDRLDKEKRVKENQKKLTAQEDEWRAELEATIAMKEARIQSIQIEKDEAMQELREMARNSQMLREQLKSTYTTDELNELAKKAHLENKMAVHSRVQSTEKNLSTLHLG